MVSSLLHYAEHLKDSFKTGHPCVLNSSIVIAHVYAALLVLTTIHAQDFEDIEGDRSRGRKTIPIVFPSASRTYMLFVLPAWSMMLSVVWGLSVGNTLALTSFGTYLGLRYVCQRHLAADRRSYLIYNVCTLPRFCSVDSDAQSTGLALYCSDPAAGRASFSILISFYFLYIYLPPLTTGFEWNVI